jgi:hypothetical protein
MTNDCEFRDILYIWAKAQNHHQIISTQFTNASVTTTTPSIPVEAIRSHQLPSLWISSMHKSQASRQRKESLPPSTQFEQKKDCRQDHTR